MPWETMGSDIPFRANIHIVTCADFRATPETFLQITPTEPILVIRNVNGHVGPGLTSINAILALDHVLNLSDIMIIHHTGPFNLPGSVYDSCFID
jgi:carbonic anhydrase